MLKITEEYSSQNSIASSETVDVESAIKEKPKPVGVFEIFKFSTNYERFLLTIGIIAGVLGGTIFPATLVIFGDLINDLVLHDRSLPSPELSVNLTGVKIPERFDPEELLKQIYYSGYLVVACGLVNMFLLYVLVASFNYAAEKQIFRLRKIYLSCILQQPISWFDLNAGNEFSSRITEDINKIHEGIGDKVGMFVFLVANSSFTLAISLYYGWKLSLVCLSTFPLMVGSSAVIARAQTTLAAEEVNEYAKAGSIVEEALSAIRTVFAFGGERSEVRRYQRNLATAKKSAMKRSVVTAIGLGIMWLIFYCAFSLGFWYGIKLVADGGFPYEPDAYDPKTLMIVLFGILFGAINIGQASPYIESFNMGRASASTIFKVINEYNLSSKELREGKRLRNFKGKIEFKNVSFSYPSRSSVQILDDIRFCVNPGESVALVGGSGSGKSTCIQLLLKFYDPSSGQILVDGFDIQHLDSDWIYENFGYVKQEPILFATTIEENIRYGKPNASLSDIIRASKEAMAHGFISKFPKGYDTLVGDRGVQLSGGQKQRIAIARIILRNPKILLLDEATSALDNQNEALIQHALNKASLGRTTIIVAHRLSTIQHADKIIVMKDGEIVEAGTHAELMETGKHYANLISAQMSKTDPVVESEENGMLNMREPYMQSIHDINEAMIDQSPLRLSRGSSVRKSALSLYSKKRKSVKHQVQDIPTVSMRELLLFAKPEWHYIFFGCLGAFVQGCTWPVYAIGFGEVLGSLSFTDADEAHERAKTIGLLFLGLGIVAGLASMLQSLMFSVSGELFTERIRKTTFQNILKQELGWFDDAKNSVGVLCSKLSADAASVHGGTGGRIGTVFQVATTLVFGVVAALVINWKLGLSALPFVPLIFIASQLEQRIFGGQTVTEVEGVQQAGKIAHEAISNMKTVRSLRVETYFMKSYTKVLYDPHLRTLRKCHLRGFIMGTSQALLLFSYLPVIFYGGYLVVYEQLPFEDIFKVGESLVMGTFMVGQAIAFAPNFNEAKMAAGRIFQIIKRKPEIDCSATGVKLPKWNPIQQIKFKNVEFCYPTRPTVSVLDGFTLTINKGETVALVGQSGSGKSTVVNILERYYNWKRGSIRIDNVALPSLNIPHVRSLFGLVSQEPVLFNRTIYENICYGDNTRTFSMQHVQEAAKQANIHDFIIGLPEGYHTLPGSKGARLSGGQKQRIAIARALIRNPQILLLDEATSALDTENEKLVQETLDEVQQNRTNIVIAHRLSTVQNADKIVVIDAGRVVEVGTHDELMKNRDYYYRLHQT